MNVLVTGANGFIGSAVCRELAHRGTTVYAIHRPGRNENIPTHSNIIPVACDLNHAAELEHDLGGLSFTLFFHFAWEGVSGEKLSDVYLQLKNVAISVACVRAAKQLGCSRFIGVGSIKEEESLLLTNSRGARPAASSAYSSCKQLSKALCKAEAARLDIDWVWGSLVNTYGAGDPSSNIINATLQKIIQRAPLQFSASTQFYDFLHVKDAARAFCLLGEKGNPFSQYVIGSSNPLPLKKFFLKIKDSVAKDREFIFGDTPGVSLPEEYYRNNSLYIDTGFKAKISFEEGIKETFEWLAQQRKLC